MKRHFYLTQKVSLRCLFPCMLYLTYIRCAPELLNEMKVMEASDFYVFGVLIWQVLHAFFQKDYVDTASGQPQAAGNAQVRTADLIVR